MKFYKSGWLMEDTQLDISRQAAEVQFPLAVEENVITPSQLKALIISDLFFVMTKLFDYEYFLITNVCNCFKKFAGESKPIKLTWNGTFSRIIGFLRYFKQNFKIIMYSFCTTINSPLISVSFSLRTKIRSCPFLSFFFFKTESIKSIQECSTMSKGCSSDSKHTSVWFSMRYLLFNVKAHKGQTLIRRSFTYR